MNEITIALCQMRVIDNKKENIKKASSMIKESKEKGAEIAILPEMFNCPYENEKFIEYGEILEESETLKSISKTAKNNNIHVLAGSIPEKVINETENKELFNTSVLFDNTGKILGYHRKIHLFDIDIPDKIYFKESDTLEAGNNFNVLETKIAKLGIGICYDVRFPELARIMTLNEADILIYPGAFNLTTGPAHWELLFRARALDNQVFTIGVSPASNKTSEYNAYGHSLVVNPMGEVIAEAGDEEELIITKINLDEINQAREEIPVLKNRRTDLYGINIKK